MSEPEPVSARAQLPPPPAPGSARYFALLYTPRARRSALARLLGLADEIGAGAARGLDHDVAHARLQWWQHEAAQYALGRSQHPWLRALPQPALDLPSLLQAAAMDLAEGQRRGHTGERLRRALFGAAAAVLGAQALSETQRAALAELATLSWQRERCLPGSGSLPEVMARLGAAAQPALAPLLVWVALAARTESGSPLQAFADNIRAWKVARRATAGTFTSP
jgi:hypothetical protein